MPWRRKALSLSIEGSNSIFTLSFGSMIARPPSWRARAERPRPARRSRGSVVVARAAHVLVQRQCELRGLGRVVWLGIQVVFQDRQDALVRVGAVAHGAGAGPLQPLGSKLLAQLEHREAR